MSYSENIDALFRQALTKQHQTRTDGANELECQQQLFMEGVKAGMNPDNSRLIYNLKAATERLLAALGSTVNLTPDQNVKTYVRKRGQYGWIAVHSAREALAAIKELQDAKEKTNG